MNLINILSKGYKFVTNGIATSFKNGDMFYIIPLVSGIVIMSIVILNRLKYAIIRKRCRVYKNKIHVINKLTKAFMKSKTLSNIIGNLAKMIGMFNNYSLDKNLEYGTFTFLGTVVFIILTIIIFLPKTTVVWYVLVFYMMLVAAFVGLVFYMIFFTARIRFTSKLPHTYKLLNSRFITYGNIQKAIYVSIDDFDKAVRKEMSRIYNVLRKNNMQEINITFKVIEETYKNQYLTLLLNLIKQAHFKGGNEIIKELFEQTTEDIMIEIENKRDLSAAGAGYIILSIFLPLGMKGIERFNAYALGDNSMKFYKSVQGIGFKFILLITVLIYIIFILLLQKNG